MTIHQITRSGMLVLGLAALLLVGTGCQDKLKAERDALYAQNQELQSELASTRSALEGAEADRARLTSELADAQKPVATGANTGAATTGANTGAANFGGMTGVSVEETAAQVTVRVAGDILFDAGRDTLKTAAKRTLTQIAGTLNRQYPGSIVRVEGHTDSDPIVKSKNRWRDNYHLAEARAISVRDYLVSQGVTRSRLMIVGHGPDKPVVSNKTRTGKSQNRRVEIIVVK